MKTVTRIGLGLGMMMVAASVVGCGSAEMASSKSAPAAPPGYAGDSAAPSRGDFQASSEAPPPPPAPPAAGASERSAGRASRDEGARHKSAEPSPADRPGLGTEWGETRFSRINTVSFVRADNTAPFVTTGLFYNDEEGARAMASSAGFRRTAGGTVPMASGVVSVGIREEGGRFLSGYTAGGKNFIVGESGQRYVIVLRNNSDMRFEVVMSVDGLDVMDGKDASFRKRGYIVDPRSELEVDGFRQSNDTVAAFRFGSVRNSYANQKHGETRNVGVIGVALFHERGTNPFAFSGDTRTREQANPFPGQFASPP